MEDEAEPLGSGEQVGRASALPTPRPSEAPDTARSAPPRERAGRHRTAAPRPPDTPDTLKSPVPPRDARNHVTHAPTVVPPASPAPELPDLDPLPPVPPAPSTPPPSPLLSLTLAPSPSLPRRSSGTPGRRSPARVLSAVLALAFLLGSSGALLLWWEQSPLRAAPHLARVLQGAALRATIPPPPRPSDALQTPPPVVPRSVTSRQAAFTRQAMKTPSKDGDDGDAVTGSSFVGAARILSQGRGSRCDQHSYLLSARLRCLACGGGPQPPQASDQRQPGVAVVGETPIYPICPGWSARLLGWLGQRAHRPLGTGTNADVHVRPARVRAAEEDAGARGAFPARAKGMKIDLADAADPPGHCVELVPVPGDAFAAVTLKPPTMANKCDASRDLDPPPLSGTYARACPWIGKYTADFNGLVCIAPDDDGSCPLGFSARFEFQEKIRDARTCTPCECGAPVGGSCVADVLLFSGASCSHMLHSGNGIGTREQLCYQTLEDFPLTGCVWCSHRTSRARARQRPPSPWWTARSRAARPERSAAPARI